MNGTENLLEEYKQKLKETEINYQFIIENTNDIISIFDKNLNLIYINDAAQRISGFSKEEVLGKKSMDFLHPDDLEQSIKIFQKALKSGEGYGEFRLKRKDGSYIWLEVNAKINVDKNGETRAILVSRDIDNRKKMENKLKESEKKYRLITENINDLILILNQSFKCEYVNEEVSVKIWGYDNSDLISKNVRNLIHPNDLKIAAKSLKKGFKKGEGEAILRVKKKDGSFAWFEIRGKGFIDEKGEEKGLLIARDITERKQAEEKSRQLFETSPFAIIVVKQSKIIVDCNSATENLIGYKKEEIIDKKFSDLPLIPPKFLQTLIERFKKVIKGAKLDPIDIKIHKKDGNEIWINYTTSLINVGNDTLLQIIVNEITERKKAEFLILEEIKKLKELDQIKTDLITRVSHEIKTPLSLICGATELLSSYNAQIHDHRANELIDILHKGEQRLKLLVKNLIDASKLESSNIKLKVQRENILAIIRDCIDEIKLFAAKRNHFITLDFEEAIYLNVNRTKMEQVFVNILLNAIKNTPPEGGIYITMKKYHKNVDILIRDNGVGLTEEEKSKLFKKFGKIERYGKGLDVDIDGSGLGLYISKKIVELHGGKIWAESAGRNKGSTFIIRLPKKY